jgi:CheY-like chemotaxis protein
MAKIFMIDDTKDTHLITKLGFPTIRYSEISQDAEFHDFVIKIFHNYDIEKLIIPVSLGNGGGTFRGLKLAMHLRLTREIGDKRLIPIVLVSDLDFDDIMIRAKNDYLNLNYLLLTEGVALVENDVGNIKAVIETVNPIPANKYQTDVLGRLKIVPSETIGKHSLANQWGAFRLDEIAQTNALINRKELLNRQKELYFKFIRCSNDEVDVATRTTTTASPLMIESDGKKILLIDDEADKGWSDVLIKMFDAADFQFIQKNTFAQFYTDAKDKIVHEDWDLILLDLRLNPEEEEQPAFIAEGDIDKYSGAQLLKVIKEKNRGTQVIIFTASNKAWNMKALLDSGADGYFIKESPELGFSYQFSQENVKNFIKNAKTCLGKKYLQDIFAREVFIKSALDNKKTGKTQDYQDFLDQLKTQIDISYDLLYNANSDTKFAYAYIALFRIVELIDAKLIDKINNVWKVVSLNTPLINYNWNDSNNRVTGGQTNYSQREKPSPFLMIANIYLQTLQLNLPLPATSTAYLERLYWATLRRNKYLHFNELRLNQQSEVTKIYSEKGYLELLTIIEGILPAL